MINDIILLAGGASIKEGISLGLKEKIKDRCVFSINYSFLHFNHTCLIFSDGDFYCPAYTQKGNYNIEYPDIYEALKKEPLIIGKKQNNGIEEFLLPNTILLKSEIDSPLTGIFALEIACKLEPKNIWLLGYDFSRSPIPEDKSKYTGYTDRNIHYYNDINHRGIGYTSFYDGHSPDNYFKPFNDVKSKIWNVSPGSLIDNFEKISYHTMFEKLDNVIENQEELRITIKSKLNEKERRDYV